MDLAPIPRVGKTNNRAEEMTENVNDIHEFVKRLIKASNAKYKAASYQHRRKVTFKAGD